FQPSELCQLCSTMVDTLEHFLVKCPAHWPVWTHTWRTLFYCEPDAACFLQVILQLQWDLIPCFSFSQYITAIQGILLAIWRSYWSYIFDRKPFVPE
ncbi:hypothetical protein BDC45DRAFT_451473, partial [Circinella umbellata]